MFCPHGYFVAGRERACSHPDLEWPELFEDRQHPCLDPLILSSVLVALIQCSQEVTRLLTRGDGPDEISYNVTQQLTDFLLEQEVMATRNCAD